MKIIKIEKMELEEIIKENKQKSARFSKIELQKEKDQRKGKRKESN